ncbi:hypothetical protein Rxyl_2390 [Rubrobacter xylanophilus DSM 9941]|uniref:Uncharacterized protein n=1 Tax=Rubrobacter xylanophilus (strain DSM 9941 / JCM 11954 / NBRC 16129 / PRD-1) TaxID=266117 RepID=Q1ATG0_RUBXD|nr:hypothetical protein [Rubrobacter xylanophilus]ABG05318.1 hypothetical protein Rxyl_2390 [Rubrobacter xylanophilus DSM 9941]
MDEKQQQKIEEAAEKFAEAVRETYQAMANRAVSAQQLNAELTQTFFNSVVRNLQEQAAGNRELAQSLMEQQRRQQEAAQELARQSMNAYAEFLSSMFAYYQGSVQRAQGR